MTISINNNISSIIAQNNLQRASLDAERAIARISSGRASAFPGDRVAEVSIATSIESAMQLRQVALETAAQASQLIGITNTAVENMLSILGRQQVIAARAVSDTVSNIERRAMQREFGALTDQFDLVAEQANYNGITLLTGDFAGDSFLTTKQDVKEIIYNITRPDQYSTHGVFGNNLVLEKNTSVEVLSEVGRVAAHGKIVLKDNLIAGDRVIINGKEFTARASSTDDRDIAADEFKIGRDLKTSMEYLVAQLNKSLFSEVTQATYSIVSEGTGASTRYGVAIKNKALGTIGNDFDIAVAMTTPEDTGISQARGKLTLSSQLKEDDVINIAGFDFVAKKNPSPVNASQFAIGHDLQETLENLAKALNASSISDIAKFTYSTESAKQGSIAAASFQALQTTNNEPAPQHDTLVMKAKDLGRVYNNVVFSAKIDPFNHATAPVDPIKQYAVRSSAALSFTMGSAIAEIHPTGSKVTITDDAGKAVDFTAGAAEDVATNTYKGTNTAAGDAAASLVKVINAYQASHTDTFHIKAHVKAAGTGDVILYDTRVGTAGNGRKVQFFTPDAKAATAKFLTTMRGETISPLTGAAATIPYTLTETMVGGSYSIDTNTERGARLILNGATTTLLKDKDEIHIGGLTFKATTSSAAAPCPPDTNDTVYIDITTNKTIAQQLEQMAKNNKESLSHVKMYFIGKGPTEPADGTYHSGSLLIETIPTGDDAKNIVIYGSTVGAAPTTGVTGDVDFLTADATASSTAYKLVLQNVTPAAGAQAPTVKVHTFGDITQTSIENTVKATALELGLNYAISAGAGAKIAINDEVDFHTYAPGAAIPGMTIGGESNSTGVAAKITLYKASTKGAVAANPIGDISVTDKTSATGATKTITTGITATDTDVVALGKLIKAVNADTSSAFRASGYIRDDGVMVLELTSTRDRANLKLAENDKIGFTAALNFGLTDQFAPTTKVPVVAAPVIGAVTEKSIKDLITANPTIKTIVGPKNVELPTITNTVELNDSGQVTPANGLVEGKLEGGLNENSGTQASVKIDFSGNSSNSNFTKGDSVYFNGERFTFAAATDALPNTQNSVTIGNNLDESLHSLAIAVNLSTNASSMAKVTYDSSTHKMTITAKKSGVAGDDYSFNFGGTVGANGIPVKYNLGAGSTSSSKVVTIGTVADMPGSEAVRGTIDQKPIYYTKMSGELTDMKATFQSGRVIDKNNFEANSVKFTVRLGQEIYETEFVSLSGGNVTDGFANGRGHQGLGDVLSGGTKLHFRRVNGEALETGFALTVKKDGITLSSDADTSAVQRELNSLIADANVALQVSEMKLGINADGEEVTRYGLDSIKQFVGVGSAPTGTVLKGSVDIVDKVGLTNAQGKIKFSTNDFVDGDYLLFNNSRFFAKRDFNVGTDLHTTMQSLADALNKSYDNNVALARYSVNGKDELLVTYRQAGSEGNEFTLGAYFVDRSIAPTKLNSISINSSKWHTDVKAVKLSMVDQGVNDEELKIGTNRKSINTVMPASLRGQIENFKADFVLGSSIPGNPDAFNPNKLRFTVIIGGEVYSGERELSGGSKRNGVVGGNGFNGLGNYLAGNSKVTLNSSDGSHAVLITLDDKGFKFSGELNSNVTTDDISRELVGLVTSISQGLQSIKIQQRRNVSNFSDRAADLTILRGMSRENIYYQASDFTADGKGGAITGFKVDSASSKISVAIGGKIYSQVLRNAMENGGLGDKYDSANKIIKGGIDTTITLTEEEGERGEKRHLTMNLQGVSDLDISTEEKANAMADALSKAFGSRESSGLRFQIGARPQDAISFNFPDVTAKAIYLDEKGEHVTVNVLHKDDAMKAVTVVHEAMDRLREERAGIGAMQSQFETIADELKANITALKGAIAVLADIDIPAASAEYALSTIRVSASSSALMHSLTSLKEILQKVLQM